MALTKAEVAAATSWLRHAGFRVGAVAKDRLFVPATGTARRVERAFGVSLGYYMVTGHRLRLANGNLSIPVSIAGKVSGVIGVNQAIEATSLTRPRVPRQPKSAATPAQEPAPPAGFRNPQPCSAYWGQKTDTVDSSSLYAPYTSNSYDICGYQPAQLRSAYGFLLSRRGSNGC